MVTLGDLLAIFAAANSDIRYLCVDRDDEMFMKI